LYSVLKRKNKMGIPYVTNFIKHIKAGFAGLPLPGPLWQIKVEGRVDYVMKKEIPGKPLLFSKKHGQFVKAGVGHNRLTDDGVSEYATRLAWAGSYRGGTVVSGNGSVTDYLYLIWGNPASWPAAPDPTDVFSDLTSALTDTTGDLDEPKLMYGRQAEFSTLIPYIYPVTSDTDPDNSGSAADTVSMKWLWSGAELIVASPSVKHGAICATASPGAGDVILSRFILESSAGAQDEDFTIDSFTLLLAFVNHQVIGPAAA
jgi:hypothetical protein